MKFSLPHLHIVNQIIYYLQYKLIASVSVCLSFTSKDGSASLEESSVSWRCLLKYCGLQTKGKNVTKLNCVKPSTPTHHLVKIVTKQFMLYVLKTVLIK